MSEIVQSQIFDRRFFNCPFERGSDALHRPAVANTRQKASSTRAAQSGSVDAQHTRDRNYRLSYGSLVDRAIMHKPFALKLLRAAMQRHYQPDGMSNGKKTKKGSTEWALGQPLVFPKTHNPTDVNLPPRCHRFRQY
jgi:hypothetical protein